MGWGGWRTWLTTGVLLCACARAPELEQVDSTPAPEAVSAVPAAPEAPDSVRQPPVSEPSAPSEPGRPPGDPGSQVEPPGGKVCGEVERTLLVKDETGPLLDASPQARILVFGHDGDLRVRDTVSGRITSLSGKIEGYTRDERRVLFSRWENGTSGAALELEVATGRVREPVPGVAVQFESYPFTPPGLLRLITKQPERVWFYDLRSTETVLVASSERCGPLNVSTDLGRVLFRDTGTFVLWDVPSDRRWRLPETRAARLLPDGAGALLLDAQGRVWGWTPEQEPVLLGQSRATSYCGIDSWPVQPASGGALLFIGTDGEATLWTPGTRRVRAVGSYVVSGQVSDGGEHVALLHRVPGQMPFVTVRTVATGAGWVVWRGEGPRDEPREMHLSGSGKRLALAVLVHPKDLDPEQPFFTIRLWNVETGAEVSLQPESPFVRYAWPSFGFHRDSTLLHVSMGDGDWMYSAETGEERFFTDRATTQGEGNYYYWGPGDIFYARAGAYLPPDHAMFAWDPRTGVETRVVGMNDLVCFLGAAPLLRTGDELELETRRAALVHWNPDTRHLETLSSRAALTRCLEPREAVVFYEDWQGPERWEGTLLVAEPKRQCRWQVDTQVELDLSVDEGLVYQARGQVWRARLP